MNQTIENTNFRTSKGRLSDGELWLIPWPDTFSAGCVVVGANGSSTGALIHARAGGSPSIQPFVALANATVTSTDISLSPPASGTGKITVGRSTEGLQVHAGAALTIAVTFLG